jgi:apolipoprotein N-acyltransferase
MWAAILLVVLVVLFIYLYLRKLQINKIPGNYSDGSKSITIYKLKDAVRTIKFDDGKVIHVNESYSYNSILSPHYVTVTWSERAFDTPLFQFTYNTSDKTALLSNLDNGKESKLEKK